MADRSDIRREGRRLPDGPPPGGPAPDLAGDAHPSRDPAHQFLHRGHQSDEAGGHLRQFYAGQADEWTAWAAINIDYLTPVEHALQNLPSRRRQLAIEVAAGTGQATTLIGAVARHVLATDAVQVMAREGASNVSNVLWVVADAGRLSVRDLSVDLVVACNAVRSERRPRRKREHKQEEPHSRSTPLPDVHVRPAVEPVS